METREKTINQIIILFLTLAVSLIIGGVCLFCYSVISLPDDIERLSYGGISVAAGLVILILIYELRRPAVSFHKILLGICGVLIAYNAVYIVFLILLRVAFVLMDLKSTFSLSDRWMYIFTLLGYIFLYVSAKRHEKICGVITIFLNILTFSDCIILLISSIVFKSSIWNSLWIVCEMVVRIIICCAVLIFCRRRAIYVEDEDDLCVD